MKNILSVGFGILLTTILFYMWCWQDASTDLYPPVGPNKPHIDLSTLMTATSRPKRVLRTTNAYFYWVTREQGSFDWFKGVMNEIAELDQRVHSTN